MPRRHQDTKKHSLSCCLWSYPRSLPSLFDSLAKPPRSVVAGTGVASPCIRMVFTYNRIFLTCNIIPRAYNRIISSYIRISRPYICFPRPYIRIKKACNRINLSYMCLPTPCMRIFGSYMRMAWSCRLLIRAYNRVLVGYWD